MTHKKTTMKKLTVGKRLFWGTLSLFLIFAVLFIVFQQAREKQFKIDMLNLHLQDYNYRMGDNIEEDGITEESLDKYVKSHYILHLRVTLIDKQGKVVYDNKRKDYRNFSNHKNRKEVAEALRQGSGFDISRESNTLHGDFFYSATYFPNKNIIIRTALPYDDDLAKSLKADQHYIWFALLMMTILSITLYRFISRLDANIKKLHIFAQRADHGESLETEDLAQFPADELGEISESIIKIYKHLQKTKEEQNELKRQLTQNVAHELKTPVASIQGYLETITGNPTISEQTRKQFLDRCYAQSQRLTSLLRDISTLNRLDDGTSMMEFENVNVTAIICQIAKETALQLEARKMTLKTHIPDPLVINGAQGMIYSIFRNLTDNAIAYAGEGTEINITARPKADGGWHFCFSDNGTGVEPQHLPRLFERFYRVDKGRSRKMGGTGLGLAIVKNAVLLHGGNITVANKPSGGLQFDFTLA